MKDKTFDGHKYSFIGYAPNKEKASHLAKHFRQPIKGKVCRARIVKNRFGYDVYSNITKAEGKK
jgi:hypothetical protein